MTYNEKKKYLENYVYSIRKIKRLLQEYEEWETIGTSITQKFNNTPVQVSGNHSRVETCAMHLANLQQTILEEMEEAEYCRSEIENAIGTIRDTRRRELLELRYIKGLSVRKIASKWDRPDKNIYKQLRNTINRMEL